VCAQYCSGDFFGATAASRRRFEKLREEKRLEEQQPTNAAIGDQIRGRGVDI